LDALVSYSEGDLRKAIMFLQSASKLYSNEPITPEAIADIAGAIPSTHVDLILNAWMTRDVLNIQKTVQEFTRLGYSAHQLLSQVRFNTYLIDFSCMIK
jgi:replication factor C subunit 2/4